MQRFVVSASHSPTPASYKTLTRFHVLLLGVGDLGALKRLALVDPTQGRGRTPRADVADAEVGWVKPIEPRPEPGVVFNFRMIPEVLDNVLGFHGEEVKRWVGRKSV